MNISKLRNTAEDGKGIFAEWIGGNWIDRNSVIIVFTQKSANFWYSFPKSVQILTILTLFCVNFEKRGETFFKILAQYSPMSRWGGGPS